MRFHRNDFANDGSGMRWISASLLTGAIALGGTANVQAEPLAELPLDSTTLRNQELEAGPVRVVVTDFEPFDYQDDARRYLTFDIYIDGEFQTQYREEVDFTFGSISLENLDPDGVPEVILHRYLGGAHCCSVFTIYSKQDDRLHRTLTYPLDASAAGGFEDLDGDGYSEFLSADPRFLYAFSSYASSWPPMVTLTFRDGTLIDVTRQFADAMRSNAQGMYEQTRESTLQEPILGANGILAGYVAQKLLLNEYESGWDYMLAHYDPTDTWGLTQYNNAGEEIGFFVSYPAALEAFLIDLEYLTYDGEPNSNLDLSRIIVESESLL
ncbi:MAG: hypothetical protein ACFB0E_13385 [Leptolyngbyaceae cyanobacterium]